MEGVFSKCIREHKIRENNQGVCAIMKLVAEVFTEFEVQLIFLSSNRVKVKSQKYAIWVLNGGQGQQQFAILKGCPVATLATKDVDVLDYTLTKCAVQGFCLLAQINFDVFSPFI